MKIKRYIVMLLAGTCYLSSCQDFLDAKPDQSMAIPSTLADLQHLLDNEGYLNQNYPALGEETADNWYLPPENWQIQPTAERENYIYQNRETNAGRWSGPYRNIFYCNLVLDNLALITEPSGIKYDRAYLEGAARFFRAHSYFQLTQVFCTHYNEATAAQQAGIVLRTSAAIEEVLKRASVAESYSAILLDLEKAAELLPLMSTIATRPNKVAAYSLLSRTHLVMGHIAEAGLYADSALRLHPHLMDYHELDAAAAFPFKALNPEIIHQSRMTTLMMDPHYARVPEALYAAYAPDDLRKTLFFDTADEGTYRFRGGLDGVNNNTLFNGISTGELYLTRAECQARQGLYEEALETLNILLVKRWAKGAYKPYELNSTDDVLGLILRERRKELIFRGIRWSDLRRLSKEGLFTGSLERQTNGNTYTLSSDDILGYAYKLPVDVLTYGFYEQN